MKLTGRVALVTGAGRNIGRATALALAREGAAVAVNARSNAQEAEAVAQEVQALGVRAVAILADVTKPSEVEALVDRVTTELGDIDILVNNAGLRGVKPFVEMTKADWDLILEGKLSGAFNCTRMVAPRMVARRSGRIINILGSLAQRGAPTRVHVAAATNGLVGFTRALALELAPLGITVNGVSPGLIDTQRDPNDAETKLIFQNVPSIPMQRLGRPEEIAATVAFLASDEAAYITGEIIAVNGGIYLA